jgi:hypothetical protein
MSDEDNDWKKAMDKIDRERLTKEILKAPSRKRKKLKFGERGKGPAKGICIMCGKRVSPYTKVIQEITNLTYCKKCAKIRGII